MDVPAFVRLPLGFDPAPLLAEATALAGSRWVSHFNADYHDGGWQGAALRAIGGDAGRLYGDPAGNEVFRDSVLMETCPRIAAELRRLECPLRAVRILRLAPGSVIREHRDDGLTLENGEARLHIPLATNDDVEFYLDGARVIMRPGECWFLDFSRPHRVQNRGRADRIHLVIDCGVNEWLTAQIAAGTVPERSAPARSAQEHFALFRDWVLERDDAQHALLALPEAEAFTARCIELGRSHGFLFGEEEVRAAMTRGRQAWLMQWML
ncbi:MAG TPA: aspartyl/asparaginyl beta-hydroxylase domain-containing protein [Usitatibacter sp.]|nr:aspartyl/asparaginyl beta-hydroxylase domain-containing protein [Usitatibacter sp.]